MPRAVAWRGLSSKRLRGRTNQRGSSTCSTVGPGPNSEGLEGWEAQGAAADQHIKPKRARTVASGVGFGLPGCPRRSRRVEVWRFGRCDGLLSRFHSLCRQYEQVQASGVCVCVRVCVCKWARGRRCGAKNRAGLTFAFRASSCWWIFPQSGTFRTDVFLAADLLLVAALGLVRVAEFATNPLLPVAASHRAHVAM